MIVFVMHPICQMESCVCNPFYTIAPISFKLGTVTRHNGQMWMKVEIIDTLDISKCKVIIAQDAAHVFKCSLV